MMFPRVSAVRRIVVVVGVLIVCGWVWLTSPMVDSSGEALPPDYHNLVHVDAKIVNVVDKTRNNTIKKGPNEREKSEKSEKLSHHHSNQTLEKMRKNMTLDGVNISDIESIIHRVNNSELDTNFAHMKKHNIKYPNPHPFNYVITAASICKNKDIFLLVYVHTAPSHYKRRMIIRQAWGNPKYHDVKIRVIFVMGITDDKPEVQQALLFESEQYGDIVQEDFQDTYKNLTYKGIAALKWVSNHCSHAKFVLKSDDDIFVNMFTLLRHLTSLDKHGVENKGILLCLVWYRMKVMREGKWKISEDEWKDSYYPTYCSGSAFTMSTDVAIALHNVSYHVPFFWVDDFYITGLLPLKLDGKVKHKQFMSTYVLDGRKLEEKFTGPQWFTYIFSHVHDLNAIQSVWEKIVRLAKGELSAKIKFALPGELPKDDHKPNKG